MFLGSVIVNAVGPVGTESQNRNFQAVCLGYKIVSCTPNPEFDFGSASRGAYYCEYVLENNPSQNSKVDIAHAKNKDDNADMKTDTNKHCLIS